MLFLVLDAKIHWEFIALRCNEAYEREKRQKCFAGCGRTSSDSYLALQLQWLLWQRFAWAVTPPPMMSL
jgi:hypothetical protein